MDSADIVRIVNSEMTVSDKIRALDAEGCPRAEIARVLGKRYQHVRNVLEADKQSRREVPGGMAERSRRFTGLDPHQSDVQNRGGGAYRLVVRDDGSVVLPPAVREAFGLQGSGAVMARLDGDEFKLISTATALRRIDELMRPYRWTGGPLVSEELIAERRAEAARESDG
jgi:bifunctional DNA-binding transcriptional regulator/antitoxin component of YhaV-PrlF toxin-antitoxin module